VVVCTNCGKENPEGFQFCGYCTAPLGAPTTPGREVRKTVTVVFTDVTGSTALGERLDPESLRRVMGRYFDEVRAVLERHGGTVEKFIGDAVMAVFGIPQLHEDDALRAVRAAWGMQEALAALNERLQEELGVAIQTRTGVNTGEVVAGDASVGQTLVTGDAVNVAARLEQAAAPGEVLLGPATYRLVRDAVEVEPTEPLNLKGKEEPVPAYRLRAVIAGAAGTTRHTESPLVGRDRELSMLQWAFDRAVSERTSHLATVLGAAGVGKSRLAEEFVHRTGSRATVLRGRCLPYGDGITFWAVVEAMHQAGGITDQDDPAEARAKLAGLVQGEEQADRIAERVAQVMGLVANHAVPEETLWAIRKLFESVARDKPLVLVFDDIHWAEPTFLDLIEHIADWSREAPILLLCLGRHELLDLRPHWGGGKMNATTISLEPLTEDQSEQLVGNLLGRAELPAEASARIADAAEGNPLFVEEMVGMLIDDGLLRRDDGHWIPTRDLSTLSVPPTIQALLAARLDRLASEERQVIERASVMGRTFYRGAVTELAPDPLKPDVARQLLALVRRELIRPQRSEFAGEDTYRFRHILIRDSAYEAMPKEVRADLHERFAAWLEHAAGERVREFEEIIAYHLEQAFRYRTELGVADERIRDLGARAGRLLASSGLRAEARGDNTGAVKLLAKAAALLPPDDEERIGLLAPLANGLHETGEFAEATEVAQELVDVGERTGDRVATLRGRQRLLSLRSSTDPRARLDEARIEQDQLQGEAETTGDIPLVVEALLASAMFAFSVGQAGLSLQLAQRAHAEAPPDRPQQTALAIRRMGLAMAFGPTPVPEGITLLRSLEAEARGTPAAPFAHGHLAHFLAMAGQFAESLDLLDQAERAFEEFGLPFQLRAGHWQSRIRLMAGRPEEAEDRLRAGLAWLQSIDERALAPTTAYLLGQILYEGGKYADAEDLAILARDTSQPADTDVQYGWRMVLSKALARRGEFEEAERLARESVEILEPTDWLNDRGWARWALAEVLRLAGRLDEAAEAARGALAEYERKGNVVMARRVRELLAELRD
jgi:class 3 adenylate cyclase/tetratricopeptide (TPR) repeat protein